MQYDFAVFVGRFQPLHNGHQHIIDQALRSAMREKLSASKPRDAAMTVAQILLSR